MASLLINNIVYSNAVSLMDTLQNTSGTGAAFGGFQGGGNSVVSAFSIMQGAIADASTMLYGDRTTDILLNVDISTFSPNGANAVTYTAPNMLTLDLGGTVLTPIRSGTATWFRLAVGSYPAGSTTYQVMTGTVSTPGGGGDLILQTTAISTTSSYFLRNVNIILPQTYTV